MRLLCAGEAFEDLVFVGLDHLPAPGEEIKTDRFMATLGGGAVITALAAARLGMRAELVSALGPGAVARLKKSGIRVCNLRRPHEPHAVSAALSTQRDRAFVTFNGINSKLETRLASHIRSAALTRSRISHCHFAFYPHHCSLWVQLLGKLRGRGITSSWDFGWNESLARDRGLNELIDALDFVFINESEAKLYTGESSLESALAHWRKRQCITIVKLGPEGAAWISPHREVLVPAPAVRQVVDTTGAGDNFNAGFLVAWMRGQTPKRCLALGNRVGAASTRRAGGL